MACEDFTPNNGWPLPNWPHPMWHAELINTLLRIDKDVDPSGGGGGTTNNYYGGFSCDGGYWNRNVNVVATDDASASWGFYTYIAYHDDGYLYAADGWNDELLVMDVSDPTTPTVVDRQALSPDADGMCVGTDQLYMVANDYVAVWDISTRTSPVFVNSVTPLCTFKLGRAVGGVNG